MLQYALDAGANLIICNKGETPFDKVAHLRVDAKISSFFPFAVKRMKELLIKR